MKKIILIIALLASGFALKAQGQEAYIKAMQKALQSIGSAQDVEAMQGVASQFERIAAKVSSEWEPNYYAALMYVNMSLRADGLETKDQYTATAQGYLDKAKELSPENAEIVVLQGYNYMAQLAADPNSRGQMLAGKTSQTFGTAMGMDPQNPRAMALMAQMQYGTAQFFGSPTDDACALAKKSLPIFDGQETGKSFNPTWGKEVAESLIGQCGN